MIDFLEPINLAAINADEAFKTTHLGSQVSCYETEIPALENVDIIIIGCAEYKGQGIRTSHFDAANAVRKELYNLFVWHNNVRIADVGNVKKGYKLQDSVMAMASVLKELKNTKAKIVIIGGGHDMAMAQTAVYNHYQEVFEMVNIDATIDLEKDNPYPEKKFLLEMLTQQPNYISQYSHIGFQSYFVQPDMLETIDKLGFECYRVGKVKEDLLEIEPIFREASVATVDINAIANAFSPASTLSPNGFNGEEICALFNYMGMSDKLSTIGIYGYVYESDRHNLTAKQLAHAIWYLIDGVHKMKQESNITDTANFNQFHIAFSQIDTVFMQSKKTGRWWMKLLDGKFVACSHKDYDLVVNNHIPDRLLRVLEK